MHGVVNARFIFIINTVLLIEFSFRASQRSPKGIWRRNIGDPVRSVALLRFCFHTREFFKIEQLQHLRGVEFVVTNITDFTSVSCVVEVLTLDCLDKMVCAMEFGALGFSWGSVCATQALTMSHKT